MSIIQRAKEYAMAKADMSNLFTFGLTFAVSALAFVFILQIMGDVKGDLAVDSAEANATDDAITGLSNVTAKFGIIGTVFVASVLIGLIVTAFRFQQS